MSPPEHFLFGALFGSAVHAACTDKSLRHWAFCAAASGTAAVLPDLDAGAQAYGSANAWIGHRGWTHSLLFAALCGICAAAWSRLARPRMSVAAAFLCMFGGVCLHILGDMPTPAGSWGGLPVFFPHEARFGGWGRIGWYDPVLFWQTIFYFLLSAAFVAAARFSAKRSPAMRLFAAGAALAGFAGAGWHIAHSRYTDSVRWHSEQQQQLKEMPWPVYEVSAAAGRLGAKIYADVRARARHGIF